MDEETLDAGTGVQNEETAETPDESVEQSQPEETESVSEDVKTPETEGNKGDLNAALRQERIKRRQLEQQANDPQFILAQARKLNLVEGDEPAPQAPHATAGIDVRAEVQTALDYEKAVAELPDLATDPVKRSWAASLVENGYTHLEAAQEIKKTLEGKRQEAVQEGAKQKETAISDKERAQTISRTDTQNTVDRETELREQTKSYDRKTRDAATLELIKLRDKKAGII